MVDRQRWRRLRWRLEGATMWPAFLAALVVDTALLRVLPIAGDTAPDVFAAALLALFFNLLAAAVGAPLAGRSLRRRRPWLPKVVADDRAGTALIGVLAVVLAGLGLAHRPAIQAPARDFDLQAARARAVVLAHAPAAFRANVDHMDTWTQAPGLYRTCAPGPTSRRSWCVLVDTRQDPPRLAVDHDRSPNAVLAGPDNPGRQVR